MPSLLGAQPLGVYAPPRGAQGAFYTRSQPACSEGTCPLVPELPVAQSTAQGTSQPTRNEKRAGVRSPWGIPYLLSIPVGLEGVLQSMVTSFLRHRSMSTALKKATDWGRSLRPSL